MTVDVTSRSSTAASSDFPPHYSFLTGNRIIAARSLQRSGDVIGDDFNIDDVRFDRMGADAEKLEMSDAIGRATTLVMAIGCGAVVATVYSNQPMLGIMEAAFPGQVWRPWRDQVCSRRSKTPLPQRWRPRALRPLLTHCAGSM
jgi:hypothetical protein